MQKGKIAEFQVLSKLIASGLDLYTPIVDRGIDCIIRIEKTGEPAKYFDIQIKGARYGNVSIRGSKKIAGYIHEKKPTNYFLIIAMRENGGYKYAIYLTTEQVKEYLHKFKKGEIDINVPASDRDALIKSQSIDVLISKLKG